MNTHICHLKNLDLTHLRPMNKVALLFLVMITIASCTVGIVDHPEIGMRFNSDIWADRMESGTLTRDQYNFYQYVGPIEGGYLYKKNPRYYTATSNDFKGGIIVSSGRVTKVLSVTELNKFISDINQQQLQIQVNVQQQQRQSQIAKEKQDKIDAENKRQNQIRQDNLKYGTSGVVFIADSIGRECLVRDGWICRMDGTDLIINGSVRNNTDLRIKDIKLNCQNIAKSGTVLDGGFLYKTSASIYDIWNPGEIRKISFKISDFQQRNSTNCRVIDWINLN